MTPRLETLGITQLTGVGLHRWPTLRWASLPAVRRSGTAAAVATRLAFCRRISSASMGLRCGNKDSKVPAMLSDGDQVEGVALITAQHRAAQPLAAGRRVE